MGKLLVVIDMQEDFITGALGSPEAVKIVKLVEKKIADELSEGNPVVFTKDTHNENYLSTQEGKNLPVKHCIKGTKGWELAPELKDYELGCPVFEKDTFGSTELARFISRNSYDEIELVGVCTDICIISNALLLKAVVPEARLSVDSSCCAGVTKESHENALKAMKACQIEIK